MKDIDIYSAVYDIVDENMNKTGQKLRISKELVLSTTIIKPGKVDILKLSRERNNETFVKKAYIFMLNRQIDGEALRAWKPQYKLPPEEFQHNVVATIKGSEEFFKNQVRMYNNIYSENTAFGGRLSGIGRTAGIPVSERLLKVYRKMPPFMKKAAKKVLGAGK
ncbi:MAG: hypothetical protein Q4A05_02120 [Ruminococcus sp.]|nr:hypothetical protein [Ruminococcus sp.]